MMKDRNRMKEVLEALRKVVASKDHEQCYAYKESVSQGHYIFMVDFDGVILSGREWFHMTFPLFQALRNEILREGEYVFVLDRSYADEEYPRERLPFVRWAVTSGHIYRRRGYSHYMASDNSQEVMNHPKDQKQILPITLVSEQELQRMMSGPWYKRLWRRFWG